MRFLIFKSLRFFLGLGLEAGLVSVRGTTVTPVDSKNSNNLVSLLIASANKSGSCA